MDLGSDIENIVANTSVSSPYDEEPTSAKPRPDWISFFCASSVAMCFTSFLFVAMLLICSIPELQAIATSKPCNCTIENYDIETYTTGNYLFFNPRLHASYVFEGFSFKANETFGYLSSSNSYFRYYDTINSTVTKYLGTEQICFVDPNLPYQFLLDPSFNPNIFWIIISFSIVSVFSIVVLLLTSTIKAYYYVNKNTST